MTIEEEEEEEQPPQIATAINNHDFKDNDDDDDDDAIVDAVVSSGSYYSSKDFPSLSSIAMYCAAIHSIPRIALYAYTHSRDKLHQQQPQSIRGWGQTLVSFSAAGPKILLLGGATCSTFFGLGLWQLGRLSEDWNVADDRYQQLQLEPLNYGNFHSGAIRESLISQELQQQQQPLHDGVLVGVEDVTNKSNKNNNSNKNTALQQQKEMLQQLPYRRRWIRGRFRHDKEVLIGPRVAPPGVPTKSEGAQGFCVLTPLEVERKANESVNTTNNYPPNVVVWINRGWIPKTLLPKWTDRPHYYEPRIARVDKLLRERPSAWYRPDGIVELTAIPSKTEKSTMFLTPEHDFLTRPLQMFWIDGRSLKSIAGPDLYTPEDLATEQDDVSLFTQVTEIEHHDATHTKHKHPNNPINEEQQKQQQEIYPLLPPVSSIGKSETKHPFTHMGYAATWFGISGATWVMTRKLLGRGRF